MSSLINIMLLEPKCGKYVVEYLKKNIKNEAQKELVASMANNELLNSVKNELQEESLLFIQIIKELKFKLTSENLISIIKSGNDFAIVIALDIWKNQKKCVIRTKLEARNIMKAIKILVSELKGEGYSNSRWFLLHEIRMHSLIDATLMPVLAKNDFFDKLYSCRITFYKGIKNNLY